MQPELRRAKEDARAALLAGLARVADRLLPRLLNSTASDWRLLGSSLLQVEREIEGHLETCASTREVHQVASLVFAPGCLETRVKTVYLFARLHPARPSGDPAEGSSQA